MLAHRIPLNFFSNSLEKKWGAIERTMKVTKSEKIINMFVM